MSFAFLSANIDIVNIDIPNLIQYIICDLTLLAYLHIKDFTHLKNF